MRPRLISDLLIIAMSAASAASARAQDRGTVNPKPLPPLANPDDPNIGAKELFGRKTTPTAMPTRVRRLLCQGLHRRRPRRCRSTAPTWQVMRLSRNRYWGIRS